MQRGIIINTLNARDDFSRKLCARAYLRKTGVVEPSAVRRLYQRDVDHDERANLYADIDIAQAMKRALDRGQEVSAQDQGTLYIIKPILPEAVPLPTAVRRVRQTLHRHTRPSLE